MLQLSEKKGTAQELERTLTAVSPLATLARGYAILTDKDKNIVRDAEKYSVDTKLNAQLANGRLTVKVTAPEKKD